MIEKVRIGYNDHFSINFTRYALAVQTHFQKEIAELIVSSLNLEMAAEEISPDEQLFYDGLGLDSIDALELSLVLSQKYGVTIRSDDERIQQIFGSLGSLAAFVEQNKTS